ncbi:MAG: glycosyltransferase family 2 protein [Clostridia bacterium]|nr:glycosyltransferase family 2 protein [Clostridia bacterium]
MELVSCVIPCYHSQKTVGKVTAGIEAVFAAHPDWDYEIILVNDNPPDETWTVIQGLCETNPKIRGICFSRNFGQHAALMAGYRHVRGDIVVSLDDDGQNPPEQMFRLINAIDGEHDIVYASEPEAPKAWWRVAGSKMTNRMFSWLMNKPRDLYLSSYYAAKRFVIEDMVRCQSPFPYVDGLALQTTTRYRNVQVDSREREEGQSGYTLRSLIKLWTNGFTAFSIKPLRIATFTGGLASIAGFVMGLVLIIRKLVWRDAIDEGWTSLMALMLVLFGILMMVMGLVGEYVGRIFVTMNRSPQYIIKIDTGERENRDE